MNSHCLIRSTPQRNDRSTRSARAKSLDLSHVTEVKSKKKKTSRSSLTKPNLVPTSPKRSIAVGKSQVETSHSASVHSFEEVLYDQLVALMALVLKSNSSRTFHDYSMLQDHIETRAVAAVEEELQAISSKLLLLQGPNPNHRVSAYAQLLASLTHNLENAVFNIDRRAVTNMKNDNLAVKVEQEQKFAALSEKLARKDQAILAMQAEQASMEFKNKSLIRTVELLSKELEKCNSNLTAAHQRSVEVRMQAIDFKAEVDKRAQRVMRSVHSRVGFVPESIQKQLGLLTALLAPGDANYDKVRMELYKKASTLPGGTASAPCSPMGASRKGAAAAFFPPSGGLSSLPSSPRSSFASRRSSTSSRSTDRSSLLVMTEPDPVSAGAVAEDASGPTHSFSPNFEKVKFLRSDTLSTSASVSHSSPAGGSATGSRLSPSRRDAQRRQVLITSLFPRASFNLQESTGIADLSFPTNQYDTEDPEPVEDAPVSKAKGSSVQVSAAVQQAARTALGAPSLQAQGAGKEHMQPWHPVPAVPMDDSIVDSDSESVHDSLDAARYQHSEMEEHEEIDSGSEGDAEQTNEEDSGAEDSENDDDDDMDMGETRTNPNASQVSFSSSSDTEGEGSLISSTSPGADDELPTSGNPSQSATHSASYGIAMAAHPPGTTLHYLPKVPALPHTASAAAVAAGQACSESDEGSNFYGNMQRFLRSFEQAHLVDVSDSSEADGESKGRSSGDHHPNTTTTVASTASRHSGGGSSNAGINKRLVGSTKLGKNTKETGTSVAKKPTKRAIIS